MIGQMSSLFQPKVNEAYSVFSPAEVRAFLASKLHPANFKRKITMEVRFVEVCFCGLISIICIDTLVAIIDRLITENFKNKPFTPPPDNLMTNFERQVQTVTAFCEEVKGLAPELAQKKFQAVLLLSLNESEKGMYSAFHDRAIIRYGYDHHNAIRLAYM